MEVVTKLRRLDIFVGTVLNLYRRPYMWAISACPGLLIFVTEASGRRDDPDPLIVIAVLAAIAILATLTVQIFSVCVGASVMAFRPGSMPGVLGRHTYRIGPEGFVEETDVNSSTLSWRGVHRVRESRLGVLVQLPNTSAHYIPRRFFNGADEMRGFTAEAERYRLTTTRPDS